MSTSIQEQDLIQKIKELEQRLNDIERRQRSVGIATFGNDSNVKIDGVNNNIIVSESGIPKILLGKL